MEEALIGILLANAGVSAIVGNRVYPAVRRQGSPRPALVLTRITGERDYAMDGATGLVRSRMQLDAWGRTYGEAKGAARAAIAALNGISGTHGGVEFQAVFIDGEQDDATADGTGRVNQPERLTRVRIDLMVWHREDE